MLKVELHTHTADDPRDPIPHTTEALIERAAAFGYDAVAITLHDRQLDVGPYQRFAADRGVVLIPGIERTVHGRHVLLINFPSIAEGVERFEDIADLKAHGAGLVVAPHPFFPATTCLRHLMDRYAHLFDAVEINHFYTRRLDFNRQARRWAAAHGLPLVGNGDVHRLSQLGKTYSLVDADRDPASICGAVRAGRVEVRTSPLSLFEATAYFSELLIAGHRKRPKTEDVAGETAPEHP